MLDNVKVEVPRGLLEEAIDALNRRGYEFSGPHGRNHAVQNGARFLYGYSDGTLLYGTERQTYDDRPRNTALGIDTLLAPTPKQQEVAAEAEYTGGSVSYYKVEVKRPTNKEAAPYVAECNDIIEALGMSYAEGNAFKAIWRRAAAANLGLAKAGYKDGKYDAEKVVFFGERMVIQEENNVPV